MKLQALYCLTLALYYAVGFGLVNYARTRPRLHSMLYVLFGLYPLMILGLMSIQVFSQQTEGFFALVGIFAPYLLLSTLAILPFACLRRFYRLRWFILACAIWWLLGYAQLPRSYSNTQALSTPTLRVLNWNSLAYNDQDTFILPLIRSEVADVFVFEETGPDRIVRDQEILAHYPYVWAEDLGSDVVVVSRFPLEAVPEVQQDYSILEAYRQLVVRVHVSETQSILLIAVHPYAPDLSIGCWGFCYATQQRDAQLRYIRQLIQQAQALGEPVLAVGDFNISPHEPTYQVLSDGLFEVYHDAIVRSSPNNSWPLPKDSRWYYRGLTPLFPLIKIDHMFSSKDLIPQESQIDCTLRGSDHCMLWATFVLQSPERIGGGR